MPLLARIVDGDSVYPRSPCFRIFCSPRFLRFVSCGFGSCSSPLPSSLWVDELGTLFVIHFGAAHPSLNAAPQVPASIYYVIPWLSERLLGVSETSWRLGSVLCMGLALIVLARISAKLLGPPSAWLVVL